MNAPRPLSRRQRGLTLTEILIALTIVGLASVGALQLLIQGLNIYHYDQGRILVNEDIRSFTTDMSRDAVYSNFARVLPDFSTRSVTSGGTTRDAFVADAQSGDCLLLFYCDTDTSGVTTINRIVGYYRTPASQNDPKGPVRRFVRDISPAVNPATTPIYQILNTHVPANTANTNPVVLQLAQGLADGKLFYNYKDQAVMVRGQIIEEGNTRRRAVNTYNFTVAPRG